MFVGVIDFNFVLKIFLYLEGSNRNRELLGHQFFVGSGLNVQGRKCFRITGVMAKHWMNSEPEFYIFFFSVILYCYCFI